MKNDYLTIEWKARKERYAKGYSHYTIDSAESFYGLFQQRRLRALLRESRGSVLDVGCADSPLIHWLTVSGHLVVGVDVIVPSRIPNMKSQRCNFICCVAEYLPFRKNSFDTIVMGEIIEHVVDPNRVFEEAWRVSNDKILLTTPNIISNPLAKYSPDHLRAFSYKTLFNFIRGFHANARLVKQPILPPLPSLIQKVIYAWARKRYVPLRQSFRTGTLVLGITNGIVKLLEEMSRFFPMLSATLIIECRKV